MLKAICENCILQHLTIETALDSLIVADLCSSADLKDFSIEFILKNASDVMDLEAWDHFAQKHAKLSKTISKKMAAVLKHTSKRFKSLHQY